MEGIQRQWYDCDIPQEAIPHFGKEKMSLLTESEQLHLCPTSQTVKSQEHDSQFNAYDVEKGPHSFSRATEAIIGQLVCQPWLASCIGISLTFWGHASSCRVVPDANIMAGVLQVYLGSRGCAWRGSSGNNYQTCPDSWNIQQHKLEHPA